MFFSPDLYVCLYLKMNALLELQFIDCFGVVFVLFSSSLSSGFIICRAPVVEIRILLVRITFLYFSSLRDDN